MEKVANLNTDLLLHDTVKIDQYNKVLFVYEVNGENILKKYRDVQHLPAIRFNALQLTLITEGNATLTIDYRPFKVHRNNLFIILPTHTIVPSQISNDSKSISILATKEIGDMFNRVPRSYQAMTNYMEVKNNPVIELTDSETAIIKSKIEHVREKIKMEDNPFKEEMILNSFVGLMLEIGYIFSKNKDIIIKPALTRKEELFEKFLQLLFNQCKEQHDVVYYADKLCITPQYLSLILKELSGKTTNVWIDEALIMESKILLKAPNTSVQEVADALRFSNQSTFGKFFKKHVGISPLEYRKS